MNNSATPLERPEAFQGKETLTDEELKALKEKAAEVLDGGDAFFADDFVAAAVEDGRDFRSFDQKTGNYNQFWIVEREIFLTGRVTRMEWINPHAWVHMDVAKEDGTTESWSIEGGTPNALLRRGFTKNSLLPGTEIVVRGYQAKDGSRKANGRDLTLPDGQKLFMGSSGTGAPKDGADPTEKKREKPK